MSDENSLNSCENGILIRQQNDVVLQQPILETEALPSDKQIANNKSMLIEDSEMCGAAGDAVFKEQSASTSIENDCNLLNNATRGKRRRRKKSKNKIGKVKSNTLSSDLLSI